MFAMEPDVQILGEVARGSASIPGGCSQWSQTWPRGHASWKRQTQKPESQKNAAREQEDKEASAWKSLIKASLHAVSGTAKPCWRRSGSRNFLKKDVMFCARSIGPKPCNISSQEEACKNVS